MLISSVFRQDQLRAFQQRGSDSVCLKTPLSFLQEAKVPEAKLTKEIACLKGFEV